jgi:hypothetical protein
MSVDTKSRHCTAVGHNVFLHLGFSRKGAERLLAQADARIDESIRAKQNLAGRRQKRLRRRAQGEHRNSLQ